MGMKRKHTILGKPRIAYHGRIYTITEVPAHLPDGRKMTFEYVHRVPTVVILAFDAKRRLILTREYKEMRRGFVWHLPVGKIEKGHTAKAAAQKELREEAGFKAKKLWLFHQTPQHFAWPLFGFIASGLIPSRLPGDPGEDIRPVPTSLKKAEQLALTGKLDDPFLAYLVAKAAYLVRTKGWQALL
ncbi:NUDIX hydrolase [Candidatus Parcubacteria bacterium]|jgi:8-oxo-dGTP pyrophosphatase MutT (NUDIX family)|nr:MAG: NUDIX hydrolase [Candidatus Parcubacteria bacterium]